MHNLLMISAGSETRTRMPVKAHAPETCASTNSAIPADMFVSKAAANVQPFSFPASVFLCSLKFFL